MGEEPLPDGPLQAGALEGAQSAGLPQSRRVLRLHGAGY